MSESILVPVLGESVTEATVAKWLKNEGDKVTADEAIVELETDKVNVEVPSPSNGTLEKISVQEGQTVNVGALLGTMSAENSSVQNSSLDEKKYSPPPKKLEVVKEAVQEVQVAKKEKVIEEEVPLILTDVKEDTETSKASVVNFVSPAARKMVAESKLI